MNPVPGIKASSNTYIHVSGCESQCTKTVLLPANPVVVRFLTKTNFHMVKGIDNAFDHMELCVV